ncbi:glycosyltransferase family 2 protein [Pelagibacterium lacus]|uniref:Glycosyltransferase family 2 protein n=1 Tax=Pelagibacterium lacus TaxID=2282655 RepID=A0A369W210_9HYPH|nr:glycosyltransferase family A protein [Pelagibacterium lacus]RDE08059.1 glycosyltransferase family 2 protein [Pelagibacterium lacus]
MTEARQIDVLMPHFNDPDGLALSLASLDAQTATAPLRVVVYDDGSDTVARERLRAIVAARGGRLELIEGATNRGRPFSRNALLDAIESPYVTWLDAGDEWYPAKLEAQLAALGAREAEAADPFVWVTCNYDWKWIGARARICEQRVDQDQVRALMVGRNLRAYLWTLLAPAEAFRAVGPFDLNLPRLQDLDFFLRFVLKGGEIIKPAGRAPLCVYHKSDTGRDADQIRACNQYVFEKHRPVYERYGRAFVQGRLFEMDLLGARIALKNKDMRKGTGFLARASLRKPLSMTKRLSRVARRALQR